VRESLAYSAIPNPTNPNPKTDPVDPTNHTILTLALFKHLDKNIYCFAIRHDVHWLVMVDCILLHITVIVYRCLRGTAPDYLSELCVYLSSHSSPFTQIQKQPPAHCPTSHMVNKVLVYLAQPSGTAFQTTLCKCQCQCQE